jgi:hypothetical protein
MSKRYRVARQNCRTVSAVEPGSCLAYTFRWEPPDPNDRETVVVLSLQPLDESTALTVDQGDFATEERRSLHVQGWSGVDRST